MSTSASRCRLPSFLLAIGLLLPACSDSPGKVVKNLGEYATKRKLVQFRDSFSLKAQEALQRQFREDGLTDSEGWRDLMTGYLGKDRQAPEVVSEEITGEESATVRVSKDLESPKGSKEPPQTIVQELSLVKQDDEWKLALGPMKYQVQKEKKEKKEKEEKPLAAEEEELRLGEKKGKEEKVEDIDLEDF